MLNTAIETHKLERELKRNGIEVEFFRSAANDYGEPVGEESSVGSLTCILHQTSEKNYFVERRSSDQSTVRTYRDYLMLAKVEDVEALGIAIGDVVRLSETLRVIGWVNVHNWGIYAEISLERLDEDGND